MAHSKPDVQSMCQLSRNTTRLHDSGIIGGQSAIIQQLPCKLRLKKEGYPEEMNQQKVYEVHITIKHPEEFNWIGSLQEFCMKHGFQLPIYTMHVRSIDSFKFKCFLSRFVTLGQGKSKQLAKKIAAYHMLMKIKELSVEEIAILCCKPYKHKISYISFKHLNDFTKQLEVNEANKYEAIDLLKSIGSREGFSIEYICIDDGSETKVVLIQLTTTPVISCTGSGENANEAKISAAVTTLKYLKNVVKH